MKVLTTEIDGVCNFIVGKLDHLYNDYFNEIRTARKIDSDLSSPIKPALTKESVEEIKKTDEKYRNILD